MEDDHPWESRGLVQWIFGVEVCAICQILDVN